MCIGIPMKIIEPGFGYAVCESKGQKHDIDTMLIGDLSVGTWVLVFINAAREVISKEDALKIIDALQALETVMAGGKEIDHFFADLTGVEKTPELLPETFKEQHEMFSPLLTSIIEREKITVVDEASLDEFAKANGDVILLASGDFKRLVEVNDVAVILPELVKASNNALTPAVVDRESERAIQLRYRFNAFPALVFLRDGEYLGVITRVLNWNDYVQQINEILAKEPSQAPSFKLPDGCGTPPEPAKTSTVDRLIEKGAENV